jgi:hypothetical protein
VEAVNDPSSASPGAMTISCVPMRTDWVVMRDESVTATARRRCDRPFSPHSSRPRVADDIQSE